MHKRPMTTLLWLAINAGSAWAVCAIMHANANSANSSTLAVLHHENTKQCTSKYLVQTKVRYIVPDCGDYRFYT